MSKTRKYTCENDVKRHVKELLDKFGWFHWANSAGPHSVPGIEDRSALKRGRFLAVECKYGGNKLTALQLKRFDDVRAAGGVAFTVCETNLGAFKDLLDMFDKLERIVERDRYD